MGYTTDFQGKFKIKPQLTLAMREKLIAFSEERHCDRSSGGYNDHSGFPGYWCQWTPTEDGTALEWDGGEKFYNYVEWLKYLVENFFKPNGYQLEGTVSWQGEDPEDFGAIDVINGCDVIARVGMQVIPDIPTGLEGEETIGDMHERLEEFVRSLTPDLAQAAAELIFEVFGVAPQALANMTEEKDIQYDRAERLSEELNNYRRTK